MSQKDIRSGAPIDWSDPDQVATQAKIDVLRNLVNQNPMSYSEKEALVRQHMADDQNRAENDKPDKKKEPDWAI